MVIQAGILESSYDSIETFDTITKTVSTNLNGDKSCYGYCCICFGGIDIENEKVKKIEKYKELGFSKISFINYFDATYIDIMYSASIFPKHNDIIWIIRQIHELSFMCLVYRKGYQKAKFITEQLLEVTQMDKFYKKINPKNWENVKKASKMDLDPNIIIFAASDLNADPKLIKDVFPFCVTASTQTWNETHGALIKARMMAGNDQQLVALDVVMQNLCEMKLKLGSKIIFNAETFTFPFKKSFAFFNVGHSSYLVLLIDNVEKVTYSFDKYEKNILFTFDIDENGLFKTAMLPINGEMSMLANPENPSLHYFDVTHLISSIEPSHDLTTTKTSELKECENIIIFVGNSNKYLKEIFEILFTRKIIKIDLREIHSVDELKGNAGKNDGYILSFINEAKKFNEVILVLENVDCCEDEELKFYVQEVLIQRRINFDKFHIPLNECMMAVTLSGTTFISPIIKNKSTVIAESITKNSPRYNFPVDLRDTLSQNSFQRFFAVTRNVTNYMFNIPSINEITKEEMIKELNEIFENAFVKKSFSTFSFTSLIENEIEETLLSYANLHKWLGKSNHPTKKALCYGGDAVHFTILDCEHIQLKFPETNETIILKQNSTHFAQQLTFQYLPTLALHVHRAFIPQKLLESISQEIEDIYNEHYDTRTFADISLIIAEKLTNTQKTSWGCFITNSLNDIHKTFTPAEFIHYILPSFRTFCSILVYRQLQPLRIENYHLKSNIKIIGSFLEDTLERVKTDVEISLLTNNTRMLKHCFAKIFQSENFTFLSGFSIEGFEYYKNNFILKEYVFIIFNDIYILAFM